jgi:hypothetical protein
MATEIVSINMCVIVSRLQVVGTIYTKNRHPYVNHTRKLIILADLLLILRASGFSGRPIVLFFCYVLDWEPCQFWFPS